MECRCRVHWGRLGVASPNLWDRVSEWSRRSLAMRGCVPCSASIFADGWELEASDCKAPMTCLTLSYIFWKSVSTFEYDSVVQTEYKTGVTSCPACARQTPFAPHSYTATKLFTTSTPSHYTNEHSQHILEMSREQYTPPTLNQGGAGGSSSQAGGAGYTGGGFNITGSSAIDDTNRPVQYLCGDCDAKVTIKKGDAIRCKECGYRVLYKERTNR